MSALAYQGLSLTLCQTTSHWPSWLSLFHTTQQKQTWQDVKLILIIMYLFIYSRVPPLSNRQHLSNADCLENMKEDYWNFLWRLLLVTMLVALSYKHTQSLIWTVSTALPDPLVLAYA